MHHTDSNADGNRVRDGNRYARGQPNGDRNADQHPNGDADGDPDQHPNGDADGDPDQHPFRLTNAWAGAVSASDGR